MGTRRYRDKIEDISAEKRKKEVFKSFGMHKGGTKTDQRRGKGLSIKGQVIIKT